MAANPKFAKQLFELVLQVTIVVGFEHTEEEALAKTVWADEYQIVWLIFQHRDIHRLINVILIELDNLLEVRNSIRYSFCYCHITSFIYSSVISSHITITFCND